MIEVDFTIDRFERVKLDLIRYPAGEIGYRLPYEEAITQIIITPEITGGKSSLLEDVMAAKMLSDHFPDALVTFTYLPCSREDRRVSPNASYGLKSIANMFAGRKVLTIDQHSDGGEFNNAMSTKAIAHAIDDFYPTVLAFPDAGAKSRYVTLLNGIYHPEVHKISKEKRQRFRSNSILRRSLIRAYRNYLQSF